MFLFLLIYFIVWVIGWISIQTAKSTIKNKHPLEWQNLRMPNSFLEKSMASDLRFSKFLFSRKFRTLNDKNLNIACYVAIVSFVLVCIGLFLPIVVGIIRHIHP